MTRVLVASGSAIVRAGLESLVTASPALALVGSSPVIGATLAQQIEDLHPDAALVELDGRDEEVLSGVLALSAGAPACAIIVLAGDDQGSWATEALRSGVRAILPHDATAGEIIAAVEAAAAGLVVLHRGGLESLLADIPSITREVPASQPEALTPREVEVLGMMAEGLGNKTIAWRLGISEHTVKFHVGSILAKLNASGRTEAVTIGIRRGLIML